MKDRKRDKTKNNRGMMGQRQSGLTIVALAIVIVIGLLAAYGIMDLTERTAHESAEKLVTEVVDHVDGKMNEVRDATRIAAQDAYSDISDPEVLEQLVKDFVEQNEFVYGSTIAFEPYIFPELGRTFAPYSWKTSDGQVHSRQLGTETDYYEEEWYAQTKLLGSEYWCEPYYDEGGAKIMMCTFSVPIKTSNGSLIAVMTADVGLEELEQYVSSISPYQDSYIVLRSKKGSALANAERDATVGSNNVIIKGFTQTGWSVELIIPFNYLMYGNTGVAFIIGIILLIAILFVYFINRLFSNLQQRSTAEYMSVIDAISSSFSSIYMLNLLTNETVTFRDPEGYEAVIDSMGETANDFSGKMKGLVEYDCYYQDRAMMFWETTPDAIKRNLSSQDRYEVRFRKGKGDETSWSEMTVFVMERNERKEPVRAVIAFMDVNESVLKEIAAQETLEKALDTAQTASRAKTDFLFNMSHDIRTPMNAIIGFTNMARKHIDDKEKVMDCLDKTQQSGNLLLELINSVLDVSRIESGHVKLEESVADVDYSFAAIQDTMTELAAARDINISFEIGEVKDKFVYCDLERCNRIFVNIISNAIKYTPEGGRVKVRCEQIPSSVEGYGNYRYTFEDNGIGMSEEFQKSVFDQFTREKTSTVSGIQGTGLGLAVCKSFVDLMGGTIECSSKLGEGTTFTVTLPFRLEDGTKYTDPITRKVADADEHAVVSPPVIFKGKKVLLVEDNELNREIAEEILTEEGMTVESAEDGSVAVELMSEKGPDYYDFILMDIQMPVMNGYEATKVIRKMYPHARIPIIAVSANAFEEDRKASRDAGMDDHVSKPINISELFNALANHV